MALDWGDARTPAGRYACACLVTGCWQRPGGGVLLVCGGGIADLAPGPGLPDSCGRPILGLRGGLPRSPGRVLEECAKQAAG